MESGDEAQTQDNQYPSGFGGDIQAVLQAVWPNVKLFIDGYPLLEPRKGLAVVAYRLAKELTALRPHWDISLLLPRPVGTLDGNSDFSVRQKWVQYRRSRVNYLDRYWWTVAVGREQLLWPGSNVLFTYPNNTGDLSVNLAIVPDLIVENASQPVRSPAGWLKREVRRFFGTRERRRAMTARRIITHSNYVAGEIRSQFPSASDRVFVVPIAMQDGIMRMTRDAAERKLAEAGLLVAGRYVLYVGGYATRKNVPMLLRVCLKLVSRSPDFRCVFVGGVDVPAVKVAADASGGAIIPIRDVTPDELCALYNQCEFTVYPSNAEGFGLPIIEAGICEKLCLCGNNTSQVELQPDRALRANSGDEPEWLEKMERHWQFPEDCRRAGLRCRTNALRFSWEKTGLEIARLLESTDTIAAI